MEADFKEKEFKLKKVKKPELLGEVKGSDFTEIDLQAVSDFFPEENKSVFSEKIVRRALMSSVILIVGGLFLIVGIVIVQDWDKFWK